MHNLNSLIKKLSAVIIAFTISLVGVLGGPVYAGELLIVGNGTDSVNEVVFTSDTSTSVTQTTETTIVNDFEATATTGGNDASQNNGGDVAIITGDSTATTNIENSANSSSVDADFCCGVELSLEISGNASDTQNNIYVSDKFSMEINPIQVAEITNYSDVIANSGSNHAMSNNGNVLISTGDAHSLANLLNGPINSFSGNVQSGMPSLLVKIINNASNSNNQIVADFAFDRTIDIFNLADILNLQYLLANSGDNSADYGSGDVKIITGDALAVSNVINDPVNVSEVNADCCDPTASPSPSPVPTPIPSPVPTPTPATTPDPGDNGNGGNNGSGGSTGGTVNGIIADVNGIILGLSDTSGEENNIFAVLGISLILCGIIKLSKKSPAFLINEKRLIQK